VTCAECHSSQYIVLQLKFEKRGHISLLAFSAERSEIAFLGSIGAGVFVWKSLGLTASFNLSEDSWQYANAGVLYRFGD